METITVDKLNKATTFEGLTALGVDTLKNESVQIPLQFVKDAADASNAAANNPPKIVNNYWHTYDVSTKEYINTGVYVRGEAFAIKKIYASIAEMENDFSGSDVKEGEVVLINTNDVENPDNAKIYVKGASAWVFLVDMSGAVGFTGKTPQFSVGVVSKGVDPVLTITADGFDTDGNPKFKFNLTLPKGDPLTYDDLTVEQRVTLLQGLEGNLPSVPSSEIDKIRALNKQGESVNVTPNEVAELVPYVGENLIREANYVWNSTHLVYINNITLNVDGVYTLSGDFSERNRCNLYRNDALITVLLSPSTVHTFSGITTVELVQTDRMQGNWKLERGGKATPYIPNPADIARAMDYSLLTEQIVPGEYWPGTDGVRRQVYTRTLSGILPASISSIFALDIFVNAIDVAVLPNSRIITIYQNRIQTGVDIATSTKYYWTYDTNQGWFRVIVANDSYLLGGTYLLTIKYTKR